ncbi:2230_t:CDS:2 [Entrophospora sp. SA101]|nr:2230_t:CDS:2 [Entrophospora sp. SA101]
MNICGVKVGVGFIKVVGNAFATITSDKNDDLEKLLKAMTISLWYQHSHQSDENTSKLQSFAVLVYGCEFHFLSMHLIGDMYVVDEYDAFVIPDSGLNLLHIGDIVKIVKKFKNKLTDIILFGNSVEKNLNDQNEVFRYLVNKNTNYAKARKCENISRVKMTNILWDSAVDLEKI